MQAAICQIELFIPAANSLKAKRQVVKRIVERIKSRCNASVAEVDFQDFWQRAAIAVAIVGSDRIGVEQQISLVQRIVDETDGAETTVFDVEYL